MLGLKRKLSGATRFTEGVTATFTMTAFTLWGGLYVRVHDTKGYMEVKIDQNQIAIFGNSGPATV